MELVYIIPSEKRTYTLLISPAIVAEPDITPKIGGAYMPKSDTRYAVPKTDCSQAVKWETTAIFDGKVEEKFPTFSGPENAAGKARQHQELYFSSFYMSALN